MVEASLLEELRLKGDPAHPGTGQGWLLETPWGGGRRRKRRRRVGEAGGSELALAVLLGYCQVVYLVPPRHPPPSRSQRQLVRNREWNSKMSQVPPGLAALSRCADVSQPQTSQASWCLALLTSLLRAGMLLGPGECPCLTAPRAVRVIRILHHFPVSCGWAPTLTFDTYLLSTSSPGSTVRASLPLFHALPSRCLLPPLPLSFAFPPNTNTGSFCIFATLDCCLLSTQVGPLPHDP